VQGFDRGGRGGFDRVGDGNHAGGFAIDADEHGSLGFLTELRHGFGAFGGNRNAVLGEKFGFADNDFLGIDATPAATSLFSGIAP
jgi:hypothetical protein